MGVLVNVDNFVRAETARMFDGMLARSGAVGAWVHDRTPIALDEQTVIRMNRDTLYSSALVDLANGAVLTIPDPGRRYLSVMVVNEDHYINEILSTPGSHELTVDRFDTDHVVVVARTLVDPDDPDDLATVHALQDGLRIDAPAQRPYAHPDYDEASRSRTHELLLELSQGLPDSHRMFGRADQVDPVRHLIGTAFGWGGLPESEAFYVIEPEPRPVGDYTMTLRDVPVDGFWSVTIYDRDGFLVGNPWNAVSLNDLTATPDADGSVTLHLTPDGDGVTNHLYVMDGWNYALRLYRPRASVLDGTWVPPEPWPVA